MWKNLEKMQNLKAQNCKKQNRNEIFFAVIGIITGALLAYYGTMAACKNQAGVFTCFCGRHIK